MKNFSLMKSIKFFRSNGENQVKSIQSYKGQLGVHTMKENQKMKIFGGPTGTRRKAVIYEDTDIIDSG